uniref:Peptidase A1 domain-containing protein n=1 Tax=Nelumbo nucifera TaxID=4432 RepID=A0A822XTV0_NELNU|nr:TPA_asm: hypothetical protein HUJ06_025210 [Nelumbo nucifera]
MGLVLLLANLFLLLHLLIARASSLVTETSHVACSSLHQGDDQQRLFNESAGLHLTLHRRHGLDTPLPLLSDILARDEARVRSLNARLTSKRVINTTAASSKLNHLRASSVSLPLNPGESIGTGNYYVKIGLGTPTKYYAVLVDTGSSFTWLQCQPCTIYCHRQVGPTFDPSASKTHRFMSCSTPECAGLEAATLNAPSCSNSNVCIYAASYGDSSFSVGYLSKDTLTLSPSQTLPGFVYGCGQDNEGLFGQAAGLIGLARNKLSMLSQLSTKYGYAFSYCLPTAASTGSLSIGGSFDPSIYKFTPMLTDSRDTTLYFLRLTSITVAGRLLAVPATAYRTSTIIDSGTVITRLPSTVYASLKDAFLKATSRYQRAPAYSILDTCFKGKVTSVPEVRLIFQGGAELKLEPWNVVLDLNNGVTCLAFAGNSGSNGITIIGNHQQESFRVAYDVSNSRIGFAAGGCG